MLPAIRCSYRCYYRTTNCHFLLFTINFHQAIALQCQFNLVICMGGCNSLCIIRNIIVVVIPLLLSSYVLCRNLNNGMRVKTGFVMVVICVINSCFRVTPETGMTGRGVIIRSICISITSYFTITIVICDIIFVCFPGRLDLGCYGIYIIFFQLIICREVQCQSGNLAIPISLKRSCQGTTCIVIAVVHRCLRHYNTACASFYHRSAAILYGNYQIRIGCCLCIFREGIINRYFGALQVGYRTGNTIKYITEICIFIGYSKLLLRRERYAIEDICHTVCGRLYTFIISSMLIIVIFLVAHIYTDCIELIANICGNLFSCCGRSFQCGLISNKAITAIPIIIVGRSAICQENNNFLSLCASHSGDCLTESIFIVRTTICTQP